LGRGTRRNEEEGEERTRRTESRRPTERRADWDLAEEDSRARCLCAEGKPSAMSGRGRGGRGGGKERTLAQQSSTRQRRPGESVRATPRWSTSPSRWSTRTLGAERSRGGGVGVETETRAACEGVRVRWSTKVGPVRTQSSSARLHVEWTAGSEHRSRRRRSSRAGFSLSLSPLEPSLLPCSVLRLSAWTASRLSSRPRPGLTHLSSSPSSSSPALAPPPARRLARAEARAARRSTLRARPLASTCPRPPFTAHPDPPHPLAH